MEGQDTIRLIDLDRFPPTVVGHTKYEDGVDLELLDPGTSTEPRYIEIFDDDRQTRAYNL